MKNFTLGLHFMPDTRIAADQIDPTSQNLWVALFSLNIITDKIWTWGNLEHWRIIKWGSQFFRRFFPKIFNLRLYNYDRDILFKLSDSSQTNIYPWQSPQTHLFRLFYEFFKLKTFFCTIFDIMSNIIGFVLKVRSTELTHIFSLETPEIRYSNSDLLNIYPLKNMTLIQTLTIKLLITKICSFEQFCHFFDEKLHHSK